MRQRGTAGAVSGLPVGMAGPQPSALPCNLGLRPCLNLRLGVALLAADTGQQGVDPRVKGLPFAARARFAVSLAARQRGLPTCRLSSSLAGSCHRGLAGL